MLRSFAVTSASSTDHLHSNLLMSFLMTSLHILGRPGLRFPRTGFQSYTFLGMRSISMHCTYPNHWRCHFLITDVSWGCFVLVLMVLLEMCWEQVTLRIFCWRRMSKASSLDSSVSVSVQHLAAYRRVERTQALQNFIFVSKLMLRSFHILSSSLKAVDALPIRLFSKLLSSIQIQHGIEGSSKNDWSWGVGCVRLLPDAKWREVTSRIQHRGTRNFYYFSK